MRFFTAFDGFESWPAVLATRRCWALLAGFAALMVGQGLEGTLLGVRGVLEGWSVGTLGLVMSVYYVGFLVGSLRATAWLERVGHVRLFAACASVASASVLLSGALPEPLVWGATRFVSGCAFAGLYVTAEAWLNQSCENEARGSLLSVYMFVGLGAYATGQGLVNVGNPAALELFVLCSMLISVGLLPVLMSVQPAPEVVRGRRLRMARLLRVAPVGVATTLAAGAAIGAFLGFGAAWAKGLGWSDGRVTLFVALFTLGGAVLQVPLGALSDRIGRGPVIAGLGVAGAAVALAAAFTIERDGLALVLAGLFGALAWPIYTLGVARAHDRVPAELRVGASAGLVLTYSAGSALAPTGAALATNVLGPGGFYLFLTLACTLAPIAVVLNRVHGRHRMARGRAIVTARRALVR